MRNHGRAGVLIALATSVAWGACTATPEPEPVQFAAYQADLFQVPGSLTDAWADVDGDGDPDRFVGFNGSPSRLYRNDLGQGFVDVAPELGLAVERSVRTSAWGDYDADGDPDLLLGFAGDAPVTALYRNDGPGGFTDVADQVGLRLDEGTTRQASWIDVEGDGDLDLFLAMRDRNNLLFRNDGEAGFVDVSERWGMVDPHRSVGAVWFDLGDGRLDLLVGNMNGDPNTLWEAGPDGFTPWSGPGPIAAGGRPLGDEALGTVRPCVVDHDADGDFDLFFANYGPNGLLEREGDGFVDAGVALGLAVDGRYDTCAWGDFDHDGRIDLFVNGTVTGGVQYRDYLFRREGGPEYVDVTPPELLELNADHGATWVDFDLDGDLDLALNGVPDDGMHYLMQNLLRPEYSWHSIQLRLVDGRGVARFPGAEVRVFAAGSTRLLGTRLVDTGSGYDAQSDLPVHVGLPGGQPVDVEITVLVDGQRRVGRLEAIDPARHQGRVLIVRVDDDGSVELVDPS